MPCLLADYSIVECLVCWQTIPLLNALFAGQTIPGLLTSEETLQSTLELAGQMGKVTTQSRDIPGFIANRILMPYINEAVQTLYEVPVTIPHVLLLFIGQQAWNINTCIVRCCRCRSCDI